MVVFTTWVWSVLVGRFFTPRFNLLNRCRAVQVSYFFLDKLCWFLSNTFSISSKLILILPYSNLKIYRIYSDITSLISNITNVCLLSLLLFLRFYLFLDREEGGGREGEKHRCEIETWISCLPQAPNLGPGPQPRHVLWPGINWRPFSLQDDTQPTRPHQPGLSSLSSSPDRSGWRSIDFIDLLKEPVFGFLDFFFYCFSVFYYGFFSNLYYLHSSPYSHLICSSSSCLR